MKDVSQLRLLIVSALCMAVSYDYLAWALYCATIFSPGISFVLETCVHIELHGSKALSA